MKKAAICSMILALMVPVLLHGQQPKDLGRMTIYENHFYNQVLESLNGKPAEGRVVFQAIPANIEVPASMDEFETVWKMMPVSQGRTGTCWDYSAISFMESEIHRLTGRAIKISEMYIAYQEYISKAEEYIATRGKSRFSEGSEANAVLRQMKTHGLMPQTAYDGNPYKNAYPDHEQMVDELQALLQSYKQREQWDSELILAGVRVILDHYMGAPPENFMYEGARHTPMTFMREITGLDPDDYVCFMSLKSETYWSLAEYKVPDNYWHSQDYYNVPLDIFMDILKKAIKECIL